MKPLLLALFSVLLAGWPLVRSGDEPLTQAELERQTAEIRTEIEGLRKQEFLRPVAVEVTDKEGLLAYMEARMAKSTTPTDIANQETVAKLLGLLPTEMDLLATTQQLLEEQVGGFYDPEDDKFYLMSSFTGDTAKVILAHELTHALDDQLYDLDDLMEEREENSDALQAVHSVMEGSATALMNQWTLAKLSSGALSMEALSEGAGPSTDSLNDMPMFLWKPLLASYLCGNMFLAKTTSAMKAQFSPPTTADVVRAFQDPPRSSEQVLHPDKYWKSAELDEPVTLEVEAGGIPAGWELLDEDTLGELVLAIATLPPDARGGLGISGENAMEAQLAILNLEYTTDAASGWGGDRSLLFGRGAARVLHLITEWDDEDEGTEFLETMSELEDDLQRWAGNLAKSRELSGAGARIMRTGKTRVHVTSWIGVEPGEVHELLQSLVIGRD